MLILPPTLPAPAPQVPFNVDRKPLPKGQDWASLLPLQLGPYHRDSLKPPTPAMDGEARYSGKGQSFFILFGQAHDAKDLEAVFTTIENESRQAPGEAIEPEQVSMKAPHRFVLRVSKRGAFFAWTRGTYYFSIEAKEGKAALQAFAGTFPY